MTITIGDHASHERFAPEELFDLVHRDEALRTVLVADDACEEPTGGRVRLHPFGCRWFRRSEFGTL